MEIKGKVVANLGVQKGTSKAGKEWAKATVVIEYGDQYPKKVALDNMKNADSFGALAVGTEGTFHIEVESREFNGRWYTSVNCWKWENAQPQPSPSPAPSPANDPYAAMGMPPRETQAQAAPAEDMEGDSGLPF